MCNEVIVVAGSTIIECSQVDFEDEIQHHFRLAKELSIIDARVSCTYLPRKKIFEICTLEDMPRSKLIELYRFGMGFYKACGIETASGGFHAKN